MKTNNMTLQTLSSYLNTFFFYLLLESFSVNTDNNPTVLQTWVINFKLFNIFKFALGHCFREMLSKNGNKKILTNRSSATGVTTEE